jgi:hypothetical protein
MAVLARLVESLEGLFGVLRRVAVTIVFGVAEKLLGVLTHDVAPKVEVGFASSGMDAGRLEDP